jgi:16S rRNA (adenine1518-N6/adenine1519-N6)-dimethyltransferase
MNYDSPREIATYLKSQGLVLKKRWGQNFLISKDARNKIIERLKPCAGELIWEIGPGLGAMTRDIIGRGAKLVAFEIDRGMIRSLRDLFADSANFSICEGDFIKTYRSAIEKWGAPAKIFGNLPYSSASKIILELILEKVRTQYCVFTVQKELGQRMASLPGKKSYSSFSVLCQYSFTIEIIGTLSPHSFFPQPDVSSSVLYLEPKQHADKPDNEYFFHDLCRISFSSRRKTLYNNIKASGIIRNLEKDEFERIFSALGLSLDTRAEELGIPQYIALSNILFPLAPSP